MHLSFHLSQLQIPQLDQFLLFQTMRGAVDIVPGELVRELEHFGGSELTALSEAELETLKRRGYLTDLSAEHQQEQARTILRVLSENLQSLVELTFRFQPDGEHASSQAAPDLELVDELFSLADKIAGEQGVVLIHLEISAAHLDAQLMSRILDRAQAHNSMVIPQLTLAGLEALTPWLKSENFRHALLTTDAESMSLAVERTASHIINFFNQQIHPSWKCNINGMSAEQLEAMLLIFERVRQKYPFFKLHLVSDGIDEATVDNWITINGTALPFISADNESVLSTLLSFILMPNRINYKPFFAPGSHKLTCALETKRVTYESATGEELVEGFNHIRARFEEPVERPAINVEAATLIPERVFCKYALVCGCNRGINECSAGDVQQCTEVYERRLQQVLPLLLFNLQKSRRLAAEGATSK